MERNLLLLDRVAQRQLSEEERERRSALARRLHQEGRFGGAEYGKLGGRPRKKRASEIVADEAKENAQKIVNAFLDALDEEKHIDTRVRAAKQWIEIEQREEALQMEEEKSLEGLRRDQLVRMTVEKLSKLAERGVLPQQVLHVIEGEAEEVQGELTAGD